MTPTIRIDNDVYAWLQEQGRAFEDTPNSVLRRVAGLDSDILERINTMAASEDDTTHRPAAYRAPRNTAKRLCKEWGITARHALYHRDGMWYNNLERFPGCLMDPDGYVQFQSKEEYFGHLGLSVKQQTNVPGCISSLPEYIRFKDLKSP